MIIPSHSDEKTGILGIVDGITSEENARLIKADLEDLPGVHSVEVIIGAFRIRFDPAIVTEQKFDHAIKIAGFESSGFHVAA
jgi:copper chaperone CopZ